MTQETGKSQGAGLPAEKCGAPSGGYERHGALGQVLGLRALPALLLALLLCPSQSQPFLTKLRSLKIMPLRFLLWTDE